MTSRHRRGWLLAILILPILLVSIWGCSPPPTPSPTPPAPPVPSEQVVTIIEPREAALIPGEIMVTGTFSEYPPYSSIWLIVVSPDYRFHPQWPPPTTFITGDKKMWEGTARIGQASDIGMQFSIFAVAADSKADTFFREYVYHCQVTDEYPGLPFLPDGANVYYDLITVLRG